MPTRTSFAAGTPSFVDIATPDQAATNAFYGALFGWSIADLGPDSGGYTMAQIGDDSVAGIGPAQNPGPPFWTQYFAVDNCDESVKKIEAAGGTIVVPAMDVMTAGRMAVAADPNGAMFSVWQAGETAGVGLVNEHGAFCWSELNTRHMDSAKAFYADVFGWGWGGSEEYGEFMVDDRVVGGVMPMGDNFPAEVPENWLVYFAVNDVNAAAAKIKELGGMTMMEPFAAGDAGVITVAADPLGATFGVIQLSHPGD